MRPQCPKCDFILERCLCAELRPIPNKTELIILQHPSEKSHALNTVKVMTKSFERLRLYIGENFDNERELTKLIKNEKVALLFPEVNASILTSGTSAPFTHLILIDGSWRKAKKIFYSSSILHHLPRLSIKAEIKSQYRIRQSSFKNSLSTLEAATQALSVFEPELNCESALNAFNRMIDFQIEKMGRDVFEKNYQKKMGDE